MTEASRAGEPAAAASEEALMERLARLHAEHLANELAVRLLELGALKLGLSDETSGIRDLGDARLAIELLRGIGDTLERERGEAAARPLRAGLAQLQLDYVRAVQLTGQETRPAPPPAGAEPETAGGEADSAEQELPGD